MLIKTWQRYILREFFKSFFLVLLGFYGLYALIDYSNHATSLYHLHHRFSFKDISLYYAYEFVPMMEVLVPFALLIATIRTLTKLNMHHELVALMVSGLHLKSLLRPLIYVSLLFTCFLYINTEFILPYTQKQGKQINHSLGKEKKKHHPQRSVQHLVLDDQTTLLFQKYDPIQNSFFDVYWIRSIDELYRIKNLFLNLTSVPSGQQVYHLTRHPHGELVISNFSAEQPFPEMRFNKQTLFETLMPVDERPPSELWKKLPKLTNIQSEKESIIAAHFYSKMALPWLCLFAVLGPAPFCVRFSRTFPLFFLYSLSIFGLLGFYLVMDAALILGKRQVISPFWAIWTPFLCLGSLISWRFLHLKS